MVYLVFCRVWDVALCMAGVFNKMSTRNRRSERKRRHHSLACDFELFFSLMWVPFYFNCVWSIQLMKVAAVLVFRPELIQSETKIWSTLNSESISYWGEPYGKEWALKRFLNWLTKSAVYHRQCNSRTLNLGNHENRRKGKELYLRNCVQWSWLPNPHN